MNKETVFKILTIVSFIIIVILMIIVFIAEFCCESDMEQKKYIITILILIISEFILLGIIFYLEKHVKVTYKNLKSETFKLKTDKYENFADSLISKLKVYKYQDAIEIPNDLKCGIHYLIRKRIETNDIVLLIRTKELNEEILNKYLDISLCYISRNESCLNEDSIFLIRKDVRLIHIVCVDTINDVLRNLTESNVQQEFGVYNLPVGISFETGTVYIAPQKGGNFPFRYKELVRMFKKYIKNQIK